MSNQHKDPFMLGWIAAIIRWCEDLINLLSGPLLTLGLGIALIALLTNGQLLATWPILLYIWAGSQALGVDTQLVSMWDHARIALRERHYWALVGYILLGVVLAYIAWVAAQVFAMTEAYSITTGEALHRLGMDDNTWLIQRTALQVFLVALAGWTRYHKPHKDLAAEAAEEKLSLQTELELEPLRAQKRAMQMRGWRGVGAALLGNETPDRPPTGGGTPQQQPPAEEQTEEPVQEAANVVHLPHKTGRRRTAARARSGGTYRGRVRNPSVEDRARTAWKPGMSVNALERAARISRSSAQKYHAKFKAEAQAAQ